MTKRHRADVESLYVVVRVDLPCEGDDAEALGWRINVVEALPTQAEAKAEASRLGELNADKACVYFPQYVRYYPNGRGVAPTDPPDH